MVLITQERKAHLLNPLAFSSKLALFKREEIWAKLLTPIVGNSRTSHGD